MKINRMYKLGFLVPWLIHIKLNVYSSVALKKQTDKHSLAQVKIQGNPASALFTFFFTGFLIIFDLASII